MKAAERGPRPPIITISRQHGAGGGEVARQVAAALGFDLFDREIVERVARSAHLSDQLVSGRDERHPAALTEWVSAFSRGSYLSPSAYHEHLTRVIGAIAEHGGAVIVGRGAHLILGAGRALRVSVVAPLSTRIAAVAGREGLSEGDARRRIVEVDGERRQFLTAHFHADCVDASTFDIVVNTGVLGIAGAAGTICAALMVLPSLGQRPGVAA
jgi:cytidylate kinase